MALHFPVILFILILAESQCIEWAPTSLAANEGVFVCDGSDLHLRWTVVRGESESLELKWYHNTDLLALYDNGRMTVLKPFNNRVTMTLKNTSLDAGIVISGVTSQDTGNYSVEVTSLSEGNLYQQLNRTAFVFVSDGLMTTDGKLHATQRQKAEYNSSTQTFHVVLTCGTFLYLHPPPSIVEWVTPTGHLVSSSGYKDGQFILQLDRAVSSGSYTCRVPSNASSLACLQGNTSDVSASVVIDDVKSRLTLLEAENEMLKRKLKKNEARIEVNEDSLQRTHSDLDVLEAGVTRMKVMMDAFQRVSAIVLKASEKRSQVLTKS